MLETSALCPEKADVTNNAVILLKSKQANGKSLQEAG
jgi:hypothetical protein